MKQVIFLILLFSSCISSAQENQFTVEKMWSLTRLGGTQVSPNEKWAFYQTTNYDYTKNSGTTTSVIMDLATHQIVVYPEIQQGYNYMWDASNSLYFLVSEGNHTLLKKWNPQTNTSTLLNDFNEASIEGILLSPDGNHLVTLEPVKVNPTVADKYPDLPLAKARIEDDLMYRHWNAWTGENVLHLFWYTASNGSFTKKGDVMQGEPYASVTGPFGGIESVCFSKDGQVIYYATKKKKGKEFALSTNSEVYSFRIQDKITTTLTSAHKGYDTNPLINASGKTIAWLSMETDGFEADKNTLRIMDLATRQEKDLTAALDLSIEQFMWHPSKEMLFFTAAIHGTKQLFSVDIASSKITQLTHEQCDYVNFWPLKERVLLERQSMVDPTDLFELTLKTGKITQLTHVNEKSLKNCAAPSVEEKWITTTDGKKMLTWVIYPPNYDPAKKYPTLLYCQGGPQSPVSQYFSYRWNFRLMASEGYIIIAPNRRGLPGFGKEWNDAISKDWGGQAMRDYLVAVDSCVAQIPSIDATKLGAVGASYGGFSVYYLAGIHNNRFKTFVAHCGLFNLESWYGTTEELFFATSDIGGPYWKPENKELFVKNSPHYMIDKWNTPMLVIHGGKDFRVPESEGMQAFQALQLKGIPSKFLYFPEEGHWITKPQNGILWYREYFEWLATYLK
jgi:dipeptidyl aminopeptidase/acylaminoacyl peptidase